MDSKENQLLSHVQELKQKDIQNNQRAQSDIEAMDAIRHDTELKEKQLLSRIQELERELDQNQQQAQSRIGEMDAIRHAMESKENQLLDRIRELEQEDLTNKECIQSHIEDQLLELESQMEVIRQLTDSEAICCAMDVEQRELHSHIQDLVQRYSEELKDVISGMDAALEREANHHAEIQSNVKREHEQLVQELELARTSMATHVEIHCVQLSEQFKGEQEELIAKHEEEIRNLLIACEEEKKQVNEHTKAECEVEIRRSPRGVLLHFETSSGGSTTWSWAN
ncbi:hypothetical protein AAF712_013532 [Marasmius tenuissimus]|uniref:A-kinase anchor protein 9 n=1 Tax=Marasmius tenuissimus TaxID=585030 RepID=A0ABR2ZFI1_9AGAR